MIDKYHRIKASSPGGVVILHDPHLTTNVTVEDYLYQLIAESGNDSLEIDNEVRDMIIKTNTLIVIYMYTAPGENGVVNYYRTMHYDMEALLDEAWDVLTDKPAD